MHKELYIIVLFMGVFTTQAQVESDTIDNKYLEDQLYLSFSYNILVNKPKGQESSLFSGDIALGFIKDLPINKRRNIGVGIGVGYNYKSYKNNTDLFSDNPDEGTSEETLTNKIKLNLVEIPFELRWRTSTATKYKFWRVYAGFKTSYAFHSKIKVSYEDREEEFKNSSVLENLQYGLTLSAGFGTWNLCMYYGLTPVFNNVSINGKSVDLKDFSIGLKFYIL